MTSKLHYDNMRNGGKESMNGQLLKLVKEETKLEQQKLKEEIVQSIISGECTIPEDIVNKFGLQYDQVIHLFTDPNFTSLITKYSQAKMKMSFYGKDLIRLDQIVNSEDNKEAIQAIKLKAQLTNAVKSTGSDVNINLNLESLVKQEEKRVNPFGTNLNSSKDLSEANVIFDAEYKKG